MRYSLLPALIRAWRIHPLALIRDLTMFEPRFHDPAQPVRMSVVLDILDLARWAPSGDNSQPWRFEILGDDHVRVHAFDTRRDCVYDLEGHASQLSVGALLETIRIAAGAHQRVAKVVRRREAPVEAPVFDVRLELTPEPQVGDLHLAIRDRSVMRKPLSVRSLSASDKQRLESAVGEAYRVVWFESAAERLRLAWLAVKSAKIRLTIPEAYAVHRQIIEWNARYSEDRVPDQALGADALSLRSMRWVMASWERVQTDEPLLRRHPRAAPATRSAPRRLLRRPLRAGGAKAAGGHRRLCARRRGGPALLVDRDHDSGSSSSRSTPHWSLRSTFAGGSNSLRWRVHGSAPRGSNDALRACSERRRRRRRCSSAASDMARRIPPARLRLPLERLVVSAPP